jgi:4-nitrophenyl phosphatase
MSFCDDHPVRALILDMDGVLWRNDDPIGNLPAIFGEIERRNYQVILATNNATRTPVQYVEKLKSFGVSIEPAKIVNSGQVAALYLNERFPQKGAVYIIGEEGLELALKESGFTPVTDRDEGHPVIAVIASMDRSLTYEKLRQATLLINAGVPFIGTNPDRSFPTPDGLVPGAGSVLAALEAATGCAPVIMGKPQPEMYRAALKILGTSPTETLVVGDRLETDIAGAQKLNCLTALVLSGVTTLEAARAWVPAPDLIAPDLTGLLQSM